MLESKARDAGEPAAHPALIELGALKARARAGERGADPAPRAWLDAHPGVWGHVGDLAMHAEMAWIELIAGPDPSLRESVSLKAAELRTELRGPPPSPPERPLADRVAACWLQVHHADAAAAQARGLSLRQAEFSLKRQGRAHRRTSGP